MRTLFAIGIVLISACTTLPHRKTASSEGVSMVSPLQKRIEEIAPRPSDFFPLPRTPEENAFFQAGVVLHWKMYQNSVHPNERGFKGYALFADPYHRGMGRISFLLGSDCSNFVHRAFQLLGADYPFMKTRHWIHLARAFESGNPRLYYKQQNVTETPIDMKECVWNTLIRVFHPIRKGQSLIPGDVVVYPGKEGVLGTKGHVGFISETAPTPLVLQSRYPDGIVALPIGPSKAYYFRYVGRVTRSAPLSIKHALKQRYPEHAVPFEDACGNSGDQLQ